jgi:hypothetical protein
MNPRPLRWLFASAALLLATTQMASATPFLTTVADWQGNPIIVGDKEYVWLSDSGNWDPDGVVLINENTVDNTHTLALLSTLPTSDIFDFNYSVEIISGPLFIKSISLSSTLSKEGFSVTKEIYSTLDDLTNHTNSLGTMTTIDGSEPPSILLGSKLKIFVHEVIDQTGGGYFATVSNTIVQGVVPEPSTWLLSAFAAGGLALVRYRKATRSPADAPPA